MSENVTTVSNNGTSRENTTSFDYRQGLREMRLTRKSST